MCMYQTPTLTSHSFDFKRNLNLREKLFFSVYIHNFSDYSRLKVSDANEKKHFSCSLGFFSQFKSSDLDVKGCLISESVSLWLKSQKMGAKLLP